MNELKPFESALTFIANQFDVPGIFSLDDLPAKSIYNLPFSTEEQMVNYLLNCPSFLNIITAENNDEWEPWLEKLSCFINRNPDYKTICIIDDRKLEEVPQKMFTWIISLCAWNQYSYHVSSN